MEKKLTVILFKRIIGHVLSTALLVGLLTYGVVLLASLAYSGLILMGTPFNMHAITGRGSLMPFTGMVPLSVSYALSQLGVKNIPVVMALALLDYRHVVMVLGLSNMTGSVCYAGSVIGIRPGLHLLTSYIRQVTVPILIIIKGNEPYLICSMNLTQSLSNAGYGSVTMILIPSGYWGRALWFIKHGINVTIVNKLNSSVNIQYSYLGLGYLINYGSLKPGVNEINLPLNDYVIYAVINETPVPIGEVPKNLNITVEPIVKPVTLPNSTNKCRLIVNAPRGSNVIISSNVGKSLILNVEGALNLTLSCGLYALTAYEGGEFSSMIINLTRPMIVNLTLTSFSSELPGVENNYVEYAEAYFRGINALYVGFIIIAIIAVGVTSAGLLGLTSMVRIITWAVAPILSSLLYLTNVGYVKRLLSHFIALTLILVGLIASLTYMIISNNAYVVLIVRQPLPINPSISIITTTIVVLVIWVRLRRAVEV